MMIEGEILICKELGFNFEFYPKFVCSSAENRKNALKYFLSSEIFFYNLITIKTRKKDYEDCKIKKKVLANYRGFH